MVAAAPSRGPGRRLTFAGEARARFLAFARSPAAAWRANFRDFNAALAEAAAATIWMTGCSSWYFDDDGVPAVWPWSLQPFIDDMRAPDPGHFVGAP